jgi:hypothetical protein
VYFSRSCGGREKPQGIFKVNNSRNVSLGFQLLLQSLLFISTIFTVASPAATKDETDTTAALEQRVKAAFLYKFAGYVEWPEGSFSKSDTPITIAVMGDDALAAELNQLVVDRTVAGRPILVRKLKDIEPSGAIHILFIGRGESARLNQVVKMLQPRPILIVTDSEGALTQGSVINFLLNDGHVRFEISLSSAEKRGLKLSSRLLAVAQNVQTGTP